MSRCCVAIAALVLAAGASASDVYRCQRPNEVVYTDHPCAAGVIIDTSPTQLKQASYAASMHLRGAMADIVGLSPRNIYDRLGRPREMNVTIDGIAPIERWFYRTPNGMMAVTFRHGRVSDVTTR